MNLRPTLFANAIANDVNNTIRTWCVKRTLQTLKQFKLAGGTE
jgi:hypothetical protein